LLAVYRFFPRRNPWLLMIWKCLNNVEMDGGDA
jgi:hypothetical protein